MAFIPPPIQITWRDRRAHEDRKAFDALLQPWLEVIATWRARARQRRALAELDDRLLDDIGITRAQADEECKKPFWM